MLLIVARLWFWPALPHRPVVDDTDVLVAIAADLVICTTEAAVRDGVVIRFEFTMPCGASSVPER